MAMKKQKYFFLQKSTTNLIIRNIKLCIMNCDCTFYKYVCLCVYSCYCVLQIIMLTGNLVLLFYPVAQMSVHHLVNMKSRFQFT